MLYLCVGHGVDGIMQLWGQRRFVVVLGMGVSSVIAIRRANEFLKGRKCILLCLEVGHPQVWLLDGFKVVPAPDRTVGFRELPE